MHNFLNLSLVEGRLTREPELLYTKNGNAVCKFDIAVNEFSKAGNEVKESVSFFSINTWNKVADVCSKFLKKGSKVRVRGKLKQNTWKAKDGTNRSKIHIEAATVDFLSDGSKKTNLNAGESQNQNQEVQVPF